MSKRVRKIIVVSMVLAVFFAIIDYAGKHSVEDKDISTDNLYLKGEITMVTTNQTIYEKFVKPMIDKWMSFCGLVLLLPLGLGMAVAIYLEDPGKIIFMQKRVGKDKKLFYLHKFRTMRVDTPHDVPTHKLENPERYITRVGRVLRKYSLDEFPQIWDIFRGKMSIIGPRPALWNQDDLIVERDKYGANGVMPGLTGWAQINGRDELEIPDKAKLDGVYVKKLKKGGLRAFLFDCECFLGTIISALKHEGVVEGGTGMVNN